MDVTNDITTVDTILRTHTKLYAFGSNGAGQLGTDHRSDLSGPEQCIFHDPARETSPTNFLPGGDGDEIRKIVGGGNHTLLLTRNGNVYASGSNDGGRCAAPSIVENLLVFTFVEWLRKKNITNVAATWDASFFVEDHSKVWVCGSGAKGELGLGADVLHASVPTLVFDNLDLEDKDCSIVAISGGMTHVVVLLSNGGVYGWGGSRKGELGINLKHCKVVWKPEKLDVLFRAKKIVTGRDFTFIGGNSQNGNVLLGNVKPPEVRSQVERIDANAEVRTGWTTIYALQEGGIRGFGQGLRGQIPPPDLPLVTQLSAGSEHCVALSEDGSLLSWGWGEHGNCGFPVDHRGNVANTFNVFPTSREKGRNMAGVGAGCATSFVWEAIPVSETISNTWNSQSNIPFT